MSPAQNWVCCSSVLFGQRCPHPQLLCTRGTSPPPGDSPWLTHGGTAAPVLRLPPSPPPAAPSVPTSPPSPWLRLPGDVASPQHKPFAGAVSVTLQMSHCTEGSELSGVTPPHGLSHSSAPAVGFGFWLLGSPSLHSQPQIRGMRDPQRLSPWRCLRASLHSTHCTEHCPGTSMGFFLPQEPHRGIWEPRTQLGMGSPPHPFAICISP